MGAPAACVRKRSRFDLQAINFQIPSEGRSPAFWNASYDYDGPQFEKLKDLISIN